MGVALFSDHTLGTGGGEYYTHSLVQALLARYEVDLVRQSNRRAPDPARLETGFAGPRQDGGLARVSHPVTCLRPAGGPPRPAKNLLPWTCHPYAAHGR